MDHRDDRRTDVREVRTYARASTAAPAVLIGSIVLIVGAFLDWASGTGAATELGNTTGIADLSGYNLIDGRIAGALGIALLVAAILMWANKRVDSWFDADLLAVGLSGFAAALIAMWLLDVGNEALSADYGAYVSLAGAVIAFVGALAAIVRSGSDRATADDEGRGDVGQRRAA